MTAIATNNGFANAGLFAGLVAQYNAWKVRRETRLALNELTERELEDIGLNRADIDTVVGAL